MKEKTKKVYIINEGTPYSEGQRVIIDESVLTNTPDSTAYKLASGGRIRSKRIGGETYGKVYLQTSEVTEYFSDRVTAQECIRTERFNPAKEAAKQVGGSHYESLAIQPWEYFTANASHAEIVGACKQNILKYMRDKDNRIEDIEKLIWYANAWLTQEKKQ